ncbi:MULTISPECIES: hypothetical protein [unclassified Bradyrhizobium]|uniref:hypothetical protein n=1 Tax=unclassified Bradyrhizobium TaxID=2631580 RepID=UPI0035117BED
MGSNPTLSASARFDRTVRRLTISKIRTIDGGGSPAIPEKPAVKLGHRVYRDIMPHGASEVFIPPSRTPGTDIARHDISRGEEKISLPRLGALREQVQTGSGDLPRHGFCISGNPQGVDGWRGDQQQYIRTFH